MDTRTMTAGQIITLLKKIPSKTPVYLSGDSEGNHFSGLDKEMSLAFTENENTVVLYPIHEGLDYDDINI